MYFVGIDISKFKHDCAIVDELGDVITSSCHSAMTARAFCYSSIYWIRWVAKRK